MGRERRYIVYGRFNVWKHYGKTVWEKYTIPKVMFYCDKNGNKFEIEFVQEFLGSEWLHFTGFFDVMNNYWINFYLNDNTMQFQFFLTKHDVSNFDYHENCVIFIENRELGL